MIRKVLAQALIAVAVGAFASAASAATVAFNTSNNWTQGSLSFTGSDGTTVTAEGLLYNDDLPNPVFSGNPYIASWGGGAGGIGICSGDSSVATNTNSTASCSDNHQVDGSGSNEAVVVSFDVAPEFRVNLLSVTFAYVQDDDDYEVFTMNRDDFDVGLSLPNNCSTCTVSNFSVVKDTAFALGAYWNDDDWKLQALHYEVVPTPLPAAGMLLLAGLGAFGFVRRRKARA